MKQNPEKTHPARQKKSEAFYDDALALIHLNLTWFVMSLPVITLVPALGSVYATLIKPSQNKSTDWHRLWDGVKQYWAISIVWAVVVSLGYVLLAAGLWFFQTWDGGFAGLATIIIIAAGMLWTAINQFSLPILLLQEERKVILAIRNGFVICLRQPLTALKVTLTTLFIAAVSILLPPLWVFISVALIAQIQTHAMLDAIKKIRRKDAARDAIAAHSQSKSHLDAGDLED